MGFWEQPQGFKMEKSSSWISWCFKYLFRLYFRKPMRLHGGRSPGALQVNVNIWMVQQPFFGRVPIDQELNIVGLSSSVRFMGLAHSCCPYTTTCIHAHVCDVLMLLIGFSCAFMIPSCLLPNSNATASELAISPRGSCILSQQHPRLMVL